MPKLRKIKLYLTNKEDTYLEVIRIGEVYISKREIRILCENQKKLEEYIIIKDDLTPEKWESNIGNLKQYFFK